MHGCRATRKTCPQCAQNPSAGEALYKSVDLPRFRASPAKRFQQKLGATNAKISGTAGGRHIRDA